MISALHHVCIETPRYAESLAFYRDVLGFEILEETADFHGRDFNTWLGAGTALIELQTPKRGEEPAPLGGPISQASGLVHLCLLVDDLLATVASIEAKGWIRFKRKQGRIVYEVLGGRLAKVVAPEGTIVELREGKPGRL